MGYITVPARANVESAEIYYKDWGTGPVVTFSHGWPLNADAWDGQMLFLAPHDLAATLQDQVNAGLLAFLQS
jgi:non-heme chloroperoxidase